MKIFDAFPSKYLKASDLHDRHVQAVMQDVMMEDIGETDPKPILYFQNVPKGLVLNKTNAKVIALGYGQETEAWRDMPLILFPCMVDFRGESVEAIRVKLLRAQQGGPRAAEGRKAFIQTSADPDATAAKMGDDWADNEARKLRNAMRSGRGLEPLPRHDADGVIWDDATERAPTAEEKAEVLRQSLQRSNEALDARREARGATKPEDGLDIPAAFDRRPKASPGGQATEPDYTPTTWIELMQAAE